MSFWDHSNNQEGLRAWHMKRDWNPRCYCGFTAVARLVYIWAEDGTEQGRSRALCTEHYHRSLNIWERLRAAAPDAVAGLTVSVTGP